RRSPQGIGANRAAVARPGYRKKTARLARRAGDLFGAGAAAGKRGINASRLQRCNCFYGRRSFDGGLFAVDMEYARPRIEYRYASFNKFTDITGYYDQILQRRNRRNK